MVDLMMGGCWVSKAHRQVGGVEALKNKNTDVRNRLNRRMGCGLGAPARCSRVHRSHRGTCTLPECQSGPTRTTAQAEGHVVSTSAKPANRPHSLSGMTYPPLAGIVRCLVATYKLSATGGTPLPLRRAAADGHQEVVIAAAFGRNNAVRDLDIALWQHVAHSDRLCIGQARR